MSGRSLSNWYFVEVNLGGYDLTKFITSARIDEAEKKFSEATIELANPELLLTTERGLENALYHNTPITIRYGYRNGEVSAVKMTIIRTRFTYGQDSVPMIEVTAEARGKPALTRKEHKELHKNKSIKHIIDKAAGRSGFSPNYSRADMSKLSTIMEEIPNDGETDLEFIARLLNSVNHCVHMDAKDDETLYIIRQYDHRAVDHIYGYFKGIPTADAPIVSFEGTIETLMPSRMKGQIFDKKKGTLIPVEVKADTTNIPGGAIVGKSVAEGAVANSAVRDDHEVRFNPDDNWVNWHLPDPQIIKDMKESQEKQKLKNTFVGELELIGDPLVKLYDLIQIVGVNSQFVQGPWQVTGVRHDISSNGFMTNLEVKRPGFVGAGKVGHGQISISFDSAPSARLRPGSG